ncbi:MAG: hypothetical protein QOF22_2187 [Bradyrhizobium sp.]|nr:hypothetical protein [Bradyrhizobium sp.]
MKTPPQVKISLKKAARGRGPGRKTGCNVYFGICWIRLLNDGAAITQLFVRIYYSDGRIVDDEFFAQASGVVIEVEKGKKAEIDFWFDTRGLKGAFEFWAKIDFQRTARCCSPRFKF